MISARSRAISLASRRRISACLAPQARGTALQVVVPLVVGFVCALISFVSGYFLGKRKVTNQLVRADSVAPQVIDSKPPR